MEEENYGINWLGLFIKVIIFVVVILLAIWLISKIALRNKGLSLEENNSLFQDAVVEYFKKNLPDEKEENTVTLKKLIRLDYLDELKNEKGASCNTEKSKAKIELVDDYYSIKTELVCDSKSKTEYIKLGNNECANCDIKVEGLVINKETNTDKEMSEEKTESTDTNKTVSNTTNNTSNNTTNKGNVSGSSTTVTKKVLYEYVKYNTEYTEWYVGKVTGNNIENDRQKVEYATYCKNETEKYYTVGYVTSSSNKKYTYTLELKNIDNAKSLKVSSDSYFERITDYRSYINKRNEELAMVGNNSKYNINITDPYDLREASLKEDNFTYSISKPYKEEGKYYVDITVRIKNLDEVVPYETNFGAKAYFVPIKFNVTYTDKNNCVDDKLDNSQNYDNYVVVDTWNKYIDVYRYKISIPEYKYSESTSLEGYTKTGKTKLAS